MLKTNHYFDGDVVSIAFQTETLPATVGVMAIGEYTFDTSQRETMTVVSGALTVQLPGNETWETFRQGDQFIVEANQIFNLKVEVETAYLCTYQ
ncbi:MAG: pyrimidine/purine nucleoside phosphorylase [Gammaproteobacteria bacterium]|jgi:hypothetical protein|nr:pyrimidine/purine nucleoside phosphorylase [Gammaproteobacteria bacterium]MBT3490058.1 pyrimidine/purine nucleoside phosphorylase [Gammaproteobacteria bacterium]MBT3719480.1 pyrimidine/purine nucleoside phosphorylase [Gammaproteobacteria bacterium]MBT3843992.1 pyrimidine/purine nucleoside phosphorylase [Gammaproteobacteria bacterium]MBT3892939.1 pyrimidine/purine nucleoside phosphorylase [Gammaproteobacteria bacterium]